MINFWFGKQGHDDLCEDFVAYNRSKGTLYDGETRLFLRNGGNELLFLILLSSVNAHKLSVFLFQLKKLAACYNAPNTTLISLQYVNSTIKSHYFISCKHKRRCNIMLVWAHPLVLFYFTARSMSLDAVMGTPFLIAVYLSAALIHFQSK